jgi:hypothetical protein
MNRYAETPIRILSWFYDPYVLRRGLINKKINLMLLKLNLIVFFYKVFKRARICPIYIKSNRNKHKRVPLFPKLLNCYFFKWLYKFLKRSFFECIWRQPSIWLWMQALLVEFFSNISYSLLSKKSFYLKPLLK